jgi:hypothetical protein
LASDTADETGAFLAGSLAGKTSVGAAVGVEKDWAFDIAAVFDEVQSRDFSGQAAGAIVGVFGACSAGTFALDAFSVNRNGGSGAISLAGIAEQVKRFAGGAIGPGDFASCAIFLTSLSSSTDVDIPTGRCRKTVPAKRHKSKIALFAE